MRKLKFKELVTDNEFVYKTTTLVIVTKREANLS